MSLVAGRYAHRAPALAAYLILALTGVGAAPAAVGAEEWPTRPIRVIVPQPAGGSMDANMRAMAESLEHEFGQKVVIDNRAGANGIIAGELLAHAPGDGYTMLYTSNSFANNQVLYRKLPFDLLRDFAPATMVANLPGYMVLSNPQVSARNITDLVFVAREASARGEPLHFGSGGVGNSQHLLGELLNHRAGMQLVHVPYKGLAPMVTALLSNEVQLAFSAPTVVLPHLKTGRLTVLAYTGPHRWPGMPEVPTVAETLPGFTFEAAWHGVFLPAATSPALVERIARDFGRAAQAPKVRGFLETGGYVPLTQTPAEFRVFLEAYLREMAELMRIAKLSPE